MLLRVVLMLIVIMQIKVYEFKRLELKKFTYQTDTDIMRANISCKFKTNEVTSNIEQWLYVDILSTNLDYTITHTGHTVPFYEKTVALCGPRAAQASFLINAVFKDIENYGNFTLNCKHKGYYQVKNFTKVLPVNRFSSLLPDFEGSIKWYFWSKLNRRRRYYFNITFIAKYS
ncbi:unnamed protein product [Diamesa serratosioi]